MVMNRYLTIKNAIIDHLTANITDAYVTGDVSATANIQSKSCIILVLFMRFAHLEERSEPGAPTRDADYWIGIMSRQPSDELQDIDIDDRIAQIEDLCNAPGHGFPIFGETSIERSFAIEGTKALDPEAGITATVVARVRILEE